VAETTYEGEGMNSDGEHAGGLEPVGRRVQAPTTLLPNVLHQLGLTLEPYPVEVSSEIAVDDIVANLKDEDWRLRIAAVRKLASFGERVPVELLDAALEDEDSSVRAAAVHVLGCAGKRAPLPRLMAALHDADWHVRETAIYVLGDGRQGIPRAELAHALHDVDALVRQAARLTLHIDDNEINSVPYGRLWEQKSMQQKQEFRPQNEAEPFKAELKQDTGEAERSEYAYALHEQAQAYDSSGSSSYEHASPMSEHWEKVTNLPPRRSQKGWWGIIAATAVVFFLLGSGVTSMFASARVFTAFSTANVAPVAIARPEKSIGNFSQYSNIIQKEVSGALHMDPDLVRAQLGDGKHLSDIATAQGLSADELKQTEIQALTDATNSMMQSDGPLVQDPNGVSVSRPGFSSSNGQTPNGQATKFLDQLKGNPRLLDALVTDAFLMRD